MPIAPTISFADLTIPEKDTVVAFVSEGAEFSEIGKGLDEAVGGQLTRAAKAAEFTGKAGSTLDVVAPGDGKITRVVLVGCDAKKLEKEADWMGLGAKAYQAVSSGKGDVFVLAELPGLDVEGENAAAMGAGIALKSYSFEKYKTKKDDDAEKPAKKKARTFRILSSDAKTAKKGFTSQKAIVEGVVLARDLMNEPANVLGPVEFAAEAEKLADMGLEISVLDVEALEKEQMFAMLGVGQGSVRPSRLVTMSWNGGKKKDPTVCFVGKGVVFDTGGISIKPAGGMEDMKGDMGGAAAVIGAMKALAGRKAKANVVGILGLVENMPDGNAQRPGDIVTSKSGQTIEVINTDAEGRLVLCDALTYAQQTFKPSVIIDLATLTGAIIIALGHQHAGVFSNNDDLAGQIVAAGKTSGETAWHMPLGPEYDKLIDSKFADMKNVGGRWGGSITAAQFLGRFIENDTPWAHLDIAGTAFGAPSNDLNSSWGSGYGVRLLNQFVADNYEGK